MTTATLAQLQKENAALRRALRVLHDVANLLMAAEDVRATAYAVLTSVTAGVGLAFNRAMLFVPSQTSGVLTGLAAVGPDSRHEADQVWRSIERDAPDLMTLYEAGLLQLEAPSALDQQVRALQLNLRTTHRHTPVAVMLEDLGAEPSDALGGLFHLPTCVAAPMPLSDGQRGALVVDNCYTARVPDGVERLVLGLVAGHAGRALVAARHRAALARQARTDALTGLDARHVGMALLRHAVANAHAGGPEVALIMVDLDRFKAVNDTYGHPVGDRVLTDVAARIKGILRKGERAFRYGGEEIGLVLVGCSVADAAVAAERVRTQLEADPVTVPGFAALNITCSVGVATSARFGRDEATLLRAADDALLVAKRNGRNRVEIAELPSAGGWVTPALPGPEPSSTG